MKSQIPKTLSKALCLAAIAIIPPLTGCATSHTTAALYQPGWATGPYPSIKPITVYQPTMHYYGYGVGALQAGLMNRLH